MKFSFILILFIVSVENSFSQKTNDVYYLKSTITGVVKEWDYTKDDAKTTKLTAEAFSLITLKERIATTGKEGWIFQFRGFRKTVKQPSGTHIIDKSDTDNETNFYVTDGDLANYFEKDRKDKLLNLNGIVLPIKMRFQNDQPGSDFEVDQAISIGPMLSWTWYRGGLERNYSTTFLVGLNFTSIGVDEKTVPGVITTKGTVMGFSPTIGVNFAYKNIGFGVLSGLDVLTGGARREWAYRNSPWVGFSIGTSLISLLGPSKD